MITVERRYQEDARFHMLVDVLYDQLVKVQFTPTEIREALFLAMTKYDMLHPRPTFISQELYEMLQGRKPSLTIKVGGEYTPGDNRNG